MNKALKRLYVILIFVFMYAPIVVLMIYSFNNSSSGAWAQWKGFTFKWYEKLFQDAQIMKALQTTLFVAVVSAIVSTAIGTLGAIGIHNMGRRARNIVMNVTYLPVLSSEIVMGISLMILFVFLRVPLGRYSLLLAHITFCLPYVIISVLPKLAQMDKNMYEAALDLGAGPLVAYRKVILPEIMPGIVNGFLLAITLSIDDFVVSFFTAGAGATNLSIYIYSAVSKRYNPAINALSTIMFVVIFLLLVIVNFRTGRKEKKVRAGEAF